MYGDEIPPEESPPSMVRMAAGFYAGMLALAFVWAGAAGRLPLWTEMPTLDSLLRWGAVGLLFGLCVVIGSTLLMRLQWAQEMSSAFSNILGPLSWGQAFLLALFSGIAEELLFRGALQPTLGLPLTSLIFALVHWPPSRKLIPWTISAGLMGYAFGWGFERSGHVLGPVIAHFVINFLNLHALGRTEPPADQG